MALFWTKQMVVGALAERPAANDPRLGATVENEALYLSTDDGTLTRSDGANWWPVQIGSGGSSIDGLTSDGLTPGGIVVAGEIALGTTIGLGGASPDATNPVTSGDGAGHTTASLDPHGSLTLGNATASGAVGAVSVQGGPGQTHAPINVANSLSQNKFTVAIDGEVVTADDVLAPSGQVKGQTVGFYPLGTPGAPSTGAHSAGEMVMDSAGAIFVCTVSGTPGTWGKATFPLPGTELAYAQITANATIANTGGGTVVPGLSLTFSVPVGVKYCLEFFCAGLDENTGSTAGDLVTASFGMDSTTTLQTADVYQAAGGFGSSVSMKTPTLVGDGASHTFDVVVQNVTAGAGGALITAGGTFPAYARAISL